jgi:sRNA-binding protein
MKMTTKSDDNIAALAALFPAAFSAEPWRAHRRLKVGIGDELVARGVLGAREMNAALKQYVDRLKYQKCLAAGGARFDLEGNVVGEVSRQQRCRASRMVARIKARQLAEAATAKTEAERQSGCQEGRYAYFHTQRQGHHPAAPCPNDPARWGASSRAR